MIIVHNGHVLVCRRDVILTSRLCWLGLSYDALIIFKDLKFTVCSQGALFIQILDSLFTYSDLKFLGRVKISDSLFTLIFKMIIVLRFDMDCLKLDL